MGLPKDWVIVVNWLEYRGAIFLIPKHLSAPADLKFPEIPELPDYTGSANSEFWEKFPATPLPKIAETQINVSALEKKVSKVQDDLTVSQVKRAGRIIEYLKFGAPAHQDKPLGHCQVENSKKTTSNGRAVTDNIATWIVKKYAAGPFDKPPCPSFRSNQLLAVVREAGAKCVVTKR
jgi:hypothetical protein